MPATDAAPKVFLAISSFRNDEEVAKLLDAAHAAPDSPFAGVIVVDSMGTAAIPTLIAERGWTDTHYYSFDYNLGSAGNLVKRLQLVDEHGGDFAYTINHDGQVNIDATRILMEYAARTKRIGAAYPLRYVSSQEKYDLTGMRSLPMPFCGKAQLPADEFFEVRWGSSNMALYAMEPIRQGLCPWADLWMGWEDLGYGWTLAQHGYHQIIVPRARTVDNYEYRSHRVLGRTIRLSEKPAWYTYYRIRNLLLIARRSGSFAFYASALMRVFIEVVITMAFRSQKALRYKLIVSGIKDGINNRSGKGKLP